MSGGGRPSASNTNNSGEVYQNNGATHSWSSLEGLEFDGLPNVDDDMSEFSFFDDDEIDFNMVYALCDFTGTVEGQATVIQGEPLVLKDDSNSYWWLVQRQYSSDIGYVPAEVLESAFEKLARINSVRNQKVCMPTAAANAAKKKKSAAAARRVRFPEQVVSDVVGTYADVYDDGTMRSDEEMEGEYYEDDEENDLGDDDDLMGDGTGDGDGYYGEGVYDDESAAAGARVGGGFPMDIQITVSIAVDDELFTLQDEYGNKVGEHDEIKFRIRPDTTFEHVLFQALRLSSISEPQTTDYFLLAQLGHSEFTIESDDTIISLQHYLEISEDHIVDLLETVMRFVVVRYSDYEDEEQQQAHDDEQQQRSSVDQAMSPSSHHQAIADPEEPSAASPGPEPRSVLDLVDNMQREYEVQNSGQPSSSPSELHKQSALDALSGRRTSPAQQPHRRSGEGAPKKMPMRLSQELPEKRISITEALGGRRRSSENTTDSDYIESRWSARNPFKTLVASNRLSRQQQHLPQRVIDIDGVRTTARLSKEMSPRTSLRLSLTDFSTRNSDGSANSAGTARSGSMNDESLSEDEAEAEQQVTHMVKNFFQTISPPQNSPPAALREFHADQQAEEAGNSASSPLHAAHTVRDEDDEEMVAAGQPGSARADVPSPELEKSRAVDDMVVKRESSSSRASPDAAGSTSSSDTIANHHHMHDGSNSNSNRDPSILSDATVSSHSADHDASSNTNMGIGSLSREPSMRLTTAALGKIFSDFKALDAFMDDSISRARGLLPAATSDRSRALKYQQQEQLAALLSESNSTLSDGHSPATPQGNNSNGSSQNTELLTSLLMDVQKMSAGDSHRDSLVSDATTESSASLPSLTHDREQGVVEPRVKRVVGRGSADNENDDDPSSSSMMMMLMTDEWTTLPPTKELMTHLYVDPNTLPPTMVDFVRRSRDACEHLDQLERDLDQLMEQFVRAF